MNDTELVTAIEKGVEVLNDLVDKAQKSGVILTFQTMKIATADTGYSSCRLYYSALKHLGGNYNG